MIMGSNLRLFIFLITIYFRCETWVYFSGFRALQFVNQVWNRYAVPVLTLTTQLFSQIYLANGVRTKLQLPVRSFTHFAPSSVRKIWIYFYVRFCRQLVSTESPRACYPIWYRYHPAGHSVGQLWKNVETPLGMRFKIFIFFSHNFFSQIIWLI